MNAGKQVIIKAPASTANLGSGFDSIGVAFQLYTELYVSASTKVEFTWKEKNGELKPFPFSEDKNLILKAMKKVCCKLNCEFPPVRIIVQSDIPSTRGLGSSAAAFVAGLFAMNAWLGGKLGKEELLWLAAEEEGHPDNVGAAIFGGVFMGAMDWTKKKVYYQAHSSLEKWQWIAAIPSYVLSTSAARELLPEYYTKDDVIFNLSRYGLLAVSLLLGDEEGVGAGLEDQLHQPYRGHLIPGFKHLLERKEELGALGFMISGAGPTVIGLFNKSANVSKAILDIEQALASDGQGIDVKQLSVDQSGVQVTVQTAQVPL